MKRTNLVLIGMPASGKSTVGVILAKLIGFDFMDTDLLIQRAEKRRLSQIIADEGMDGFLDIENRVNASVEADHCVIATGGSAVYGREAMEHFRTTRSWREGFATSGRGALCSGKDRRCATSMTRGRLCTNSMPIRSLKKRAKSKIQ